MLLLQVLLISILVTEMEEEGEGSEEDQDWAAMMLHHLVIVETGEMEREAMVAAVTCWTVEEETGVV